MHKLRDTQPKKIRWKASSPLDAARPKSTARHVSRPCNRRFKSPKLARSRRWTVACALHSAEQAWQCSRRQSVGPVRPSVASMTAMRYTDASRVQNYETDAPLPLQSRPARSILHPLVLFSSFARRTISSSHPPLPFRYQTLPAS